MEWGIAPKAGNTLTPFYSTMEGQEDKICARLGTLTLTRWPEKETRFTSPEWAQARLSKKEKTRRSFFENAIKSM